MPSNHGEPAHERDTDDGGGVVLDRTDREAYQEVESEFQVLGDEKLYNTSGLGEGAEEAQESPKQEDF